MANVLLFHYTHWFEINEYFTTSLLENMQSLKLYNIYEAYNLQQNLKHTQFSSF